MDPRSKCKNIIWKTNRENLHNLGIGKETSDITPKPWKRKEKNQWIKTFCSVKDPMKRMKRQATKRERVSTSWQRTYILNIWRTFQNEQLKRILKGGRRLEQTFKIEYMDDNWLHEERLNVITIGEIQIKATGRCHFTSIRTAKIAG